jgi:predicted RNase H-like HicB family nuclease
MRYAIVIEKAGANYSAYVPDLPGCIATGSTVPDTEASIREAIELHLSAMRDDGTPIPPSSWAPVPALPHHAVWHLSGH